jgi:hypothetical protein
MSEETKYQPPESSAADAGHAVVRSALSLVPIAGGPAVELLNWLVTPSLERRRSEWMNDVADGLRRVEAAHVGLLDTLRNDAGFVDLLLQASQAAMKTSASDKREALRNAVLNVACGGTDHGVQQSLFLDLLERFTPWHLRLLKIASDVEDNSKLSSEFAARYPETSEWDRLGLDIGGLGWGPLHQTWRDLYTSGLVEHEDVINSVVREKLVTRLGEEFLRFVIDPIVSEN